MSRWIDVPALRVFEVSHDEFYGNYRRVNQKGEYPTMGEETYRVIRDSDSKVFKLARFVPTEGPAKNCHYLEEI